MPRTFQQTKRISRLFSGTAYSAPLFPARKLPRNGETGAEGTFHTVRYEDRIEANI
jgi:hypothetical protein